MNPSDDDTMLDTQILPEVPEDSPLPPAPPAVAVKPPRPRPRVTEITVITLLVLVVFLLGALVFGVLTLAGTVRGLFTPYDAPQPHGDYYAVLGVEGTIGSSSPNPLGVGSGGYNHSGTLAAIQALGEDPRNKGILLYMNTGGGGVYESDEVYRALMAYKEKTERPVWAYMANTCASGGYYICMAADRIIANHNTTTGSIGVYIALTDTSALYAKLGVETVLIRSGVNKGVGLEGVPITEEQRAVYQSIVDESYNRFVDLVVLGRSLSRETVLPLADGRPYTAKQALSHRLVDELGDWDTAQAAFGQQTGVAAFTPQLGTRTPVGDLLSALPQPNPGSEAEMILLRVEELPQGVPMAYAPGLGW